MFSQSQSAEKIEDPTPFYGVELASSGLEDTKQMVATREQVADIADFFLRYPELQDTFQFIVETRSTAQEILTCMTVIVEDAREKRDKPDDIVLKLANVGALREYVVKSIGTRAKQIQRLQRI